MFTAFDDLMQRGGLMMWPLLAMSLVAAALVLERCWFWIMTNHRGRRARLADVSRLLRRGQREEVRAMIAGDHSVYGQLLRTLLDEPGAVTDAAAIDAVETVRPLLERFMPTLSTIITAAPMVGILGTVTGIIASFQLLGSELGMATDPRQVSGGIAEALLTTAAGLVIALVVLFPYNAFRAQVDRTLGRMEVLVAACASHAAAPDSPTTTATPD